jgi:hypothetical protein
MEDVSQGLNDKRAFRPSRKEFLTKASTLAGTLVGSSLGLFSSPKSQSIATAQDSSTRYPNLIDFLNAQSPILNLFSGFGGEDGYVFLDKAHVFDKNNKPLDYDDTPLQPGIHYYEIILTSMYMRDTSTWYKRDTPALVIAVELTKGPLDGKKFSWASGTQDVPGFSGKPPDIGHFSTGDLPITPLIAYRGDTPIVHPFLVAIPGKNEDISPWLTAIGAIAGIFSLGFLSIAVTYGTKIMDVINQLVSAQQSRGRVGFNKGLLPGSTLKAGYHIAYESGMGILPDQLYLRGNRVFRGGNVLTESDSIVIHVRSTTKSDVKPVDLPDVKKIYLEATQAYTKAKPDAGESIFNKAKTLAQTSIDLNDADRKSGVDDLEANWQYYKNHFTG